MSKIIKIESIAQINEMLGTESPRHPLITLLDPAKVKRMPVVGQQFTLDLYSISLKTGHECKLKYGRQSYDFQEGTLICMAPGQMIEPISISENTELEGWTLIFHPDLIRKSALGKKINEYTFFSYDTHEALHLSNQERRTITDIVNAIRDEYSKNLDAYSHDLIITNIELLLNYCSRFYGRQFITRSNECKDVIVRFEEFLKLYFDTSQPEISGYPSVKYCAREMGYSPGYLSDLLKRETGKSTQEHISYYMIEKAKGMLLGTDEPVNKIARSMGFEYPQHFSKIFKNKTGLPPGEFRH